MSKTLFDNLFGGVFTTVINDVNEGDITTRFFDWVQEASDTPPASPLTGSIYFVLGTGTGAWAAHDNQLAYCVSGGETPSWRFCTLWPGQRVWVEASAAVLVITGTYASPTTEWEVDSSWVGAANGVAGLDGSGKVPSNQLPDSLVGAMVYKGVWNCSGGTYPTNPSQGYYYVASVAGTISSVDYEIGDWLAYNGSSWDKIDNSDKVSSVNSQTGAVTLVTDDIAEDGSPTNLWFTGARVDTQIKTVLNSNNQILTTNGSNVLTAVTLETGLRFASNKLDYNVNGLTAETSPASDDELLLYDTSTTSYKKVSVANLVPSGSVSWIVIDSGSSSTVFYDNYEAGHRHFIFKNGFTSQVLCGTTSSKVYTGCTMIGPGPDSTGSTPSNYLYVHSVGSYTATFVKCNI